MFSLGSLVPLLETCKLGVRRLIGHSKLQIDSCLCLYVRSVKSWRFIQGFRLRAQIVTPLTRNGISVENKRMNILPVDSKPQIHL